VKKFCIFLITALSFFAAQGQAFGIYNNSGTAGADSISIPFYALDSAGNVVAMASGDSVFLNVYFPDGSLAYRDSGAYNAAEVTAQTVSSYTEYTWKDAIATIDGGTPTQGTYSYILVVKDLTSAAIATPHRGTFQLITETDFNTSMEYVKDVLDTLQLWDTRVDSIEAAVADASIGDKVWTDASTRTITGTGSDAITSTSIAASAAAEIGLATWDVDNSLVSTVGSMGEILRDTLQNQDNWIAQQTEVANINGWAPITDNDSLIIDQSTLEDMTVATVTDVTNGVTLANDAITAAKIANDAIGATEIADDAIDYGTFAGTAPTAWWNEGKTGYSLDAAQWEEVWRNIDTTNIDTSEIGTWLSTGINATIDYEQVWYNIDTTNIDTSELGTWLSTGINATIDYEQRPT